MSRSGKMWGAGLAVGVVVGVTFVAFRTTLLCSSAKTLRSTVAISSSCQPAKDMPPEYFFGGGLAVRQNVLAISSSYAAYVFERNEEGVWESVTDALACNGEGSPFLVLLPSPHQLLVGDAQRNVVTVLDKSSSLPTEWKLRQEVFPEVPSNDSPMSFPSSMAVSGNTLLVGDDVQGVAFSFLRPSDEANYQLEHIFDKHKDKNLFGTQVRICGDHLLIGSLDSVFLFGRDKDKDGGWKVLDSLNVEFLRSMEMENNTVVIGRGQFSGRVEVYRIDNSKMVFQSTLQGPLPPEEIGSSLAISGDTIIVGRPPNRYTKIRGGGKAFVYQRTKRDGGWYSVQTLIPEDSKMDDFFGASVSLDKDTLAIGSPANERAHTFVRNSQGRWLETQTLEHRNNTAPPSFASRVEREGRLQPAAHSFVAF